jgi:hypothetical protein
LRQGHIKDQIRVDRPTLRPHQRHLPVTQRDPLRNARQRSFAVFFAALKQVDLVQHHQRGGFKTRRRLLKGVHRVKVVRRVHYLDQPAGAYIFCLAETDQPAQSQGFGHPAGLDNDRIQAQPRGRERGQRLVQSPGVIQTAYAAAGDRLGGIHLPGDQPRVDVDHPEVVDHHADPRARSAQQMVEQRGFPCA